MNREFKGREPLKHRPTNLLGTIPTQTITMSADELPGRIKLFRPQYVYRLGHIWSPARPADRVRVDPRTWTIVDANVIMSQSLAWHMEEDSDGNVNVVVTQTEPECTVDRWTYQNGK